MGKPTSKTEKDSNVVERILGDRHYKTTISDGKDKAEGRAKRSEKAEERASKRWHDKHNDD